MSQIGSLAKRLEGKSGGHTMSYLAVVVVVGLVIAIHECGHLLAAKMCGIPIQRFSVGFGPKLVGFRWGEK